LRILLTGCDGQVGRELERALPALGEVIATDRSALDLADPDAIRRVVRQIRPGLIVNAAAYTAVDRAEAEPEAAMAVNAEAVGILAEESLALGAQLVHFSTDYVFDGTKPTPYDEADLPKPINAYGRSKAEGERRIAASGCRHIILRTSWVYAATGRNFLQAILGQTKPLRVVNDQFGAPTSNLMLARAAARAIEKKGQGLYHLTAAGKTSWHGFACAALPGAKIEAVLSSEYKTKARRPRNSLLDNSKIARELGIQMPTWEEGLREVLEQMR
jgi:dTDP-4-dehydrorhamnose reductase